MALSVTEKIRRSLKEYGLAATLKLIARNVVDRVKSLMPLSVRASRKYEEFDRQFGIDTATPINRTDLDIASDRIETVNRYETTPIEGFHQIMSDFEIDHTAFTFIDIGSGKGRPLLLASDYPFREIIGVELSRALVDTANRNAQIYKSPTQRCKRIVSVCQDATRYEFPNSPLCLYLYNPFPIEPMKAVMANLRASLQSNPRDAFLIYQNPAHAEYLRGISWLKVVKKGRLHNQYIGEDQDYLIFKLDRNCLAG